MYFKTGTSARDVDVNLASTLIGPASYLSNVIGTEVCSYLEETLVKDSDKTVVTEFSFTVTNGRYTLVNLTQAAHFNGNVLIRVKVQSGPPLGYAYLFSDPHQITICNDRTLGIQT